MGNHGVAADSIFKRIGGYEQLRHHIQTHAANNP